MPFLTLPALTLDTCGRRGKHCRACKWHTRTPSPFLGVRAGLGRRPSSVKQPLRGDRDPPPPPDKAPASQPGQRRPQRDTPISPPPPWSGRVRDPPPHTSTLTIAAPAASSASQDPGAAPLLPQPGTEIPRHLPAAPSPQRPLLGAP